MSQHFTMKTSAITELSIKMISHEKSEKRQRILGISMSFARAWRNSRLIGRKMSLAAARIARICVSADSNRIPPQLPQNAEHQSPFSLFYTFFISFFLYIAKHMVHLYFMGREKRQTKNNKLRLSAGMLVQLNSSYFSSLCKYTSFSVLCACINR